MNLELCQWKTASHVYKNIPTEVFTFPSGWDNVILSIVFKKLFYAICYGCSAPQKAKIYLLYVTCFFVYTSKCYIT